MSEAPPEKVRREIRALPKWFRKLWARRIKRKPQIMTLDDLRSAVRLFGADDDRTA